MSERRSTVPARPTIDQLNTQLDPHHTPARSGGARPRACSGADAPPGAEVRSGFFADTAADFDGSATDELVRTVGLLVGSCGAEDQLAFLAKELAEHVERRDTRVVIDQLRWRLDRLDDLHNTARGKGARQPR